MRAEAYRLFRRSTPSPGWPAAAVMGADVEPHEDLLVRARRRAARDRARPARPRGRGRGRRGRRATSSRCRARSTRARTRSSATSSPSACSACRGSSGACASPSPTTSSPSGTRCATCSTRSARPPRCATAWDAPAGRARPGRVGPTGRDGRAGRARARGRRRARPRRAGPRARRSRRRAGPACPTRSSRPRRWPPRWSARRPRRSVDVTRARSGVPRRPRARHGGVRPGRPHVACAADADWLLLRDPRRARSTWSTRRPRCSTPLDTVDGGRRAATVDWQPTPETVVTDDPAAVALALDRGAFGAAALLVGLGAADARHDRRLRERAPAVRRADRVVPGGEAPPRRRAEGARLRPPAGLPGRPLAGDRRRHPGARRVDGQGHGVGRRVVRRPRRRSSATAPSATPSSTTSTST